MAEKKQHKTQKNPDGSQSYSRGDNLKDKVAQSGERMDKAGEQALKALHFYLNKQGKKLTPAQKKAAWASYRKKGTVSDAVTKNYLANTKRRSAEFERKK